MRRFLFGAALLFAPMLWPAMVSAQEFNHTITIYAAVPEQRAIYLDQYGGIIKIAGNTENNVQPKVYDSSNHEVDISPGIQQQYDNFLKQHGGRLKAGQFYYINPVKVVAFADPQRITVNMSGLKLGSG